MTTLPKFTAYDTVGDREYYTKEQMLTYGRAEFARALLLAAAAARPFWVMGDTIALRILQIDGIFEDNAREAKP